MVRIMNRFPQNTHQCLIRSLGLIVRLWVVGCGLPMVNVELRGHLANHTIQKVGTPITDEYFKAPKPKDDIHVQKKLQHPRLLLFSLP